MPYAIIGYAQPERNVSTKVRSILGRKGTIGKMGFRRLPGFGAAATLAIATLSVFATFQNYGPESAVRRFHHAIVTGDDAELSQVVDTSTQTSAVRDLRLYVTRALNGGANYRIVKSERSPTQVEMLALYAGRAPIVWVVVKARDRWRVDPYLTLQGLRRLGY